MSQDFSSTRAIWEWLLEKPEVNYVVCSETGASVWLKKDGMLNDSDWSFQSPHCWSKHVELPKVTIDYEQLKKAFYKHVDFNVIEQSGLVDLVAKELAL